jgi:hypothetical protein
MGGIDFGMDSQMRIHKTICGQVQKGILREDIWGTFGFLKRTRTIKELIGYGKNCIPRKIVKLRLV